MNKAASNIDVNLGQDVYFPPIRNHCLEDIVCLQKTFQLYSMAYDIRISRDLQFQILRGCVRIIIILEPSEATTVNSKSVWTTARGSLVILWWSYYFTWEAILSGTGGGGVWLGETHPALIFGSKKQQTGRGNCRWYLSWLSSRRPRVGRPLSQQCVIALI